MSFIQIQSTHKEKSETKPTLIDLKIKNSKEVSIWLVDPTYTQQQISSESMPAAIGGIATFTERNLNLKQPIRLFKYPEVLAQALEKDGIPDIIGFSNYMWNCELSLVFARRIKEVSSQTIVVMGGPNYPITTLEQEDFLRKHPEIDFYVIGEGELAFANLVATLINSDLKKNNLKRELPSVHYINADGQAVIAQTVERLKDLTEIPSPYLLGKLDEFFDGKLQPTIQTTRGCPFACTFCIEGTSYYTKIYRNSLEKITAELEYIGSKMNNVKKKGGRNDLWLVDSNFGMYSQDLDTCKAIANCQAKYGWPDYIQCDTGKNNKTRVLDAARLVNGAIRLSGSVQTLDSEVLKNIKRSNISGNEPLQLAVEAAEIDADSRSEIILGLPGESLKSHFETIKTVLNAGFNKIDNYQLMMLPGTEVNTPETKKNYGMQIRYRILPRCFGYYDVLGKLIIATEIEEICVATNTLSFKDYIKCRKMHLIIHLFYNDGLFSTTLKFIQTLGLTVFDWLMLIYDEQLTGDVKQLFDNFEKETVNELWLKRDELVKKVQEYDIIDQYIDGKLGYNLLFVHKAKALKFIKSLKELAKNTIIKFFKNNKIDTHENLIFLDEVLNFDLRCNTNIFENLELDITQMITYDVLRFKNDTKITAINEYKLKNPQKICFILTDEQKDILKRSINIYGNSELGVSRILTKVFVKKLLRKPIYESQPTPNVYTAILK